MRNGDLPAPRRCDEALAYIIERIAGGAGPPSFVEIGRRLAVSTTRAKQLVQQLVAEGTIERAPGAKRALVVRDMAETRHALGVTLQRLGWAVAVPTGPMIPLFPQGQLPRLPPLDYSDGPAGSSP